VITIRQQISLSFAYGISLTFLLSADALSVSSEAAAAAAASAAAAAMLLASSQLCSPRRVQVVWQCNDNGGFTILRRGPKKGPRTEMGSWKPRPRAGDD